MRRVTRPVINRLLHELLDEFPLIIRFSAHC
jgi:hypothetical protein